MKRFWKTLFFVVLFMMFGSTFYYLYQNSKDAPVTYEVITAKKGDIQQTALLTGKIEPRDEILIKPQLSGIISDVLKEPGDVVRVGDVIAKIKVVPDASQLSGAENRITMAKMALEQANREFKRMTELRQGKFVSGEEWEQSKLTVDKAKEEYDAAIDNLNIVKNGVSQYNAKNSNTLIRSTVNGVVLDVPVKKGNSVIMANTFNDGTTIASIADMNDLIFKGKIDETEIGNVSKGMQMKITVGALPNLELQANLEYIAPKSVESNGSNTFEIKGKILNANGKQLRAGYSANAFVVLQKHNDVVTLPESAIEYVGDSTFVYVAEGADNQNFKRVPVITGIGNGIDIEIVKGVKVGTHVRGRQQLSDSAHATN